MKIAIVGAGLAGMGVAHFLLEEEGIEVTLFDAKGVGGGASGVCSGLLHPYPGYAARRSYRAEEALALTKELIRLAEKHTPRKVCQQKGILRRAIHDEQSEQLKEHCSTWGDIEEVEEGLFMIHSGLTVYLENYLGGLFRSLQKKGAQLIIQEIENLAELSHFDRVVVAAGYGVRKFPECGAARMRFIKGQSLRVKGTPPFGVSFISKGYIAHLGSEVTFDVGSTYEKEFRDELPNLRVAKELLKEKLSCHCPGVDILECRAGVRVVSRSHHLPICEQLNEKLFLFTGLGSRGLLYHALYGRGMCQTILSKNRNFS
ncbi:MAG: tRNA 5-methylaminomethyl-2-thiouridine biosynthesis bifunctional protein MnmC [Chlamydiae bacterium]|nr:tRNA 5-methylaminomethyl-2-thiouridine biosynthesis bifunctional protein MnmC [Chlamydiota bacterium]